MAAVIPEAAAAVSEGGAAVQGASVTGATTPLRAAPARPAPAKAAPAKAAPARPAPAKAAPARPKAQTGPKKPRNMNAKRKPAPLAPPPPKDTNRKIRLGGGGRKSIGAGRYQPVILAEFLVAVLVISIPPLAKGGDKTAQAKASPSPYSTDTLKQLIAAGAVYFILALMSGSQKLGKFSAWFGGLTLLGIGLLQTANGDLQALFKIFGPAQGELSPAGQAEVQQDISGALGGALGTGQTTAVVPNPDATGLFPVIEPGGQIVTRSVVTPPPGGTGVTTTTGSDQGANLA